MDRTTREQAIQILQNNENVGYASLIEKFVWANTVKPQYKVGDAVQFTNPSTGILRHKRTEDGSRKTERKSVVWAIGKVTAVQRLINSLTFQYTIEYETDLDGWEVAGESITSHTAFPLEKDVRPADEYRPTLWCELSGR